MVKKKEKKGHIWSCDKVSVHMQPKDGQNEALKLYVFLLGVGSWLWLCVKNRKTHNMLCIWKISGCDVSASLGPNFCHPSFVWQRERGRETKNDLTAILLGNVFLEDFFTQILLFHFSNYCYLMKHLHVPKTPQIHIFAYVLDQWFSTRGRGPLRSFSKLPRVHQGDLK